MEIESDFAEKLMNAFLEKSGEKLKFIYVSKKRFKELREKKQLEIFTGEGVRIVLSPMIEEDSLYLG
jgi:hypothetical protein